MRSNVLMPLVAAVALAACGSESAPAEKQSASEVKAAMEDMVKPLPGQYRSSMKLVKFEIPGMPAAAVEEMKGMMGAAQRSTTYCLTQEDADKGFEEATKNASNAQGDCAYERFSAKGGKLDAKLKCTSAQQGEMVMEMAGTVLPDRSNLKMMMNGGAPGIGGNMTMIMEVAAERIGECT